MFAQSAWIASGLVSCSFLLHLLPISKFQILPCDQPPGFRPNVCQSHLESCGRNEIVAKVIAFPVNWTILRNLATDLREVTLPAIGVITGLGASVTDFQAGDKVLLPEGYNWVEKRCLDPDETLLLNEKINPIRLAELLGAPRIAASIVLQSRQLCIDDWLLQTEPLTSVGRHIQKLATAMRLRTINIVQSEDQKVDVLERKGDVVISFQRSNFLEEAKKYVEILGPKLAVFGTTGSPSSELRSILPAYCHVVSPVPISKLGLWWKRPIYNSSLISKVGTDEVGLSMLDFLSRYLDSTTSGLDRSSIWSMDDFSTAINNLEASRQVVLFDHTWNQ